MNVVRTADDVLKAVAESTSETVHLEGDTNTGFGSCWIFCQFSRSCALAELLDLPSCSASTIWHHPRASSPTADQVMIHMP